MDEELDIRWIQRFDNFQKAMERLRLGIKIVNEGLVYTSEVDEMLMEGLIQRFEYTQELAWKVLKDYEEYQGHTDIMGSRDAIRIGLEIGLITDKMWMKTIVARNTSSHCYDEEEFQKILYDITNGYFPLFEALENKMLTLK